MKDTKSGDFRHVPQAISLRDVAVGVKSPFAHGEAERGLRRQGPYQLMTLEDTDLKPGTKPPRRRGDTENSQGPGGWELTSSRPLTRNPIKSKLGGGEEIQHYQAVGQAAN